MNKINIEITCHDYTEMDEKAISIVTLKSDKTLEF